MWATPRILGRWGWAQIGRAAAEARRMQSGRRMALFPDSIAAAGVAVFHAVVEVEGRNGSQRFVVVALFAEGFAHVLVERVERLLFVGGRGLLFAGRRAEEFLKA